MKISNEQREIVKALIDNNVIVDAVAGSGKTTTNLFIAANNLDKKILLLTYNAKLRLETRVRCKSYGFNNMEIHTYHSFCVKYYDSHAYRDNVIDNIIKNKIKPKENSLNGDKSLNYDILILDEAQDIKPLFYRLVNKIKNDNGKIFKICILGDKNQSVYNFAGSDNRYLVFGEKCFNFNDLPWKRCKLSESFRITNEMAMFINKCMLKYEFINSNKNGIVPKYVICNTFGNNYGKRIGKSIPFDIIKNYLEDGYKPSDIFVLAASVASPNSPISALENKIKMELKDIPIFIPSSDDEEINEKITNDKLIFTTFHQAKGLERKIVIVYGFDNSYFTFFKKNYDHHRCPNELYVATTRALEHLVLLHHYKHDYLPFINQDQLENYADVVIHKELKLDDEAATEIKPTVISCTDLINHLSYEVVQKCLSYITIKPIRTKGNVISLPISIAGETVELVNNINGMAIPKYFEYLKTGKISILNKLTNNHNITIKTDYKGIELPKNVSPLFDKQLNNALIDINEIKQNLKNLSIEHLLYLSTRWWSYNKNLLHKIMQIKNYNWISFNDIQDAIKNLNSLNISNDCQFEVYRNVEYNNITLVGYIDCIDKNIDKNAVYEFKCTKQLEDQHFLQLALYAFMLEVNEASISLNPLKKHYYLYNILSDEQYEITFTNKGLKDLFTYLIYEKYSNNSNNSDEDFFLSLKII
jgi:hypothetical protein